MKLTPPLSGVLLGLLMALATPSLQAQKSGISWISPSQVEDQDRFNLQVGEWQDHLYEVSFRIKPVTLVKLDRELNQVASYGLPGGADVRPELCWMANGSIWWLVVYQPSQTSQLNIDLLQLSPGSLELVERKQVGTVSWPDEGGSQNQQRLWRQPRLQFCLSPDRSKFLIRAASHAETNDLQLYYDQVMALDGTLIRKDTSELAWREKRYEAVDLQLDHDGVVHAHYRVWRSIKSRKDRTPTFTNQILAWNRGGRVATQRPIYREGIRFNQLKLHLVEPGRWHLTGSYAKTDKYRPEGLFLFDYEPATKTFHSELREPVDLLPFYEKKLGKTDDGRTLESGLDVPLRTQLFHRPDGGWYATYEVLGYFNRRGRVFTTDQFASKNKMSKVLMAWSENVFVLELGPTFQLQHKTTISKHQITDRFPEQASHIAQLHGNDLMVLYYTHDGKGDLEQKDCEDLQVVRIQPGGNVLKQTIPVDYTKLIWTNSAYPLSDSRLLVGASNIKGKNGAVTDFRRGIIDLKGLGSKK